jgi:hypothetical protein
MAKKIFLSYTISDIEQVNLLKEQLSKQTLGVVFLEHPIIEEEWKRSVLEKIKQSDVFICLFGFSTWESEAVKWEVRSAIENHKKVFVVKLKTTVFMIPNYITENNIQILEDDVQQLANQIENS